jgi:hypothetical protein
MKLKRGGMKRARERDRKRQIRRTEHHGVGNVEGG